ncbi:calcium/sodium antiporter [Haloferula chungangensis]|uniref:Calcium/sodium antiporter n=1 Tax=Haloferula chungangensis TaxID=1048331 RepID=A0ABW2L5M3_9BACT
MLSAALLTLLSFVLLFVGAELLVRGGVGVALRLGLTSLVVGLTVVAYGTSSPELIVSVKAAFIGQSGIAVGNVVGSNIFNIAVILGLASLIKPIAVNATAMRRDAPVMLGVTVLGILVLLDSTIQRWEGVLLFLSSVIYTWWVVRDARKNSEPSDDAKPMKLWVAIGFVMAGLGVLALGSQLLVDNAVFMARTWGVSEAVIGLTIIAAGTSMPELATSVVGAIRGHSDISLGNVIGSNIFNILFVLGLASIIHPIHAQGLSWTDQGALLLSAIALLPFMWSGRQIGRSEGLILLAGYGIYLALLWPKG